MKSIGIHQVPVTQKNTVKPFKKGSSDNKNGASFVFLINKEPAKVDIAIAPMFIQYGGDKSPGENLKNV